MAQHNTWDPSFISAIPSSMPFTFMSSDHQQMGQLSALKLTAPSRPTNSHFALVNHRRAAIYNAEIVDDNFRSPASRKILVQSSEQNVITAMGDHEIETRPKDKPSIIGQPSSIALHHSDQHLLQYRAVQKSKRAENRSSYDTQEEEAERQLAVVTEEVEGGECLTPRAREDCIPHESLICPPAPRKKRRTLPPQLCKRVQQILSYDGVDQTTLPPLPPSASSSSSWTSEYLHLQQQHGAAYQVVVNPPDLHTFPACIRALFLQN